MLGKKQDTHKRKFIEKAKNSHATLLTGGYRVTDNGLSAGNFIAPTVFTDCSDDMELVQNEVFGPVMAVLKFSDEEEVIARANNTDYGLAAGVVTQNLSRAHRVIHQLEAGICWVNTWGDSPAQMPVGGYKSSGVGRENGMETLNHYTQTKSVLIELDEFVGAYE